MLYLTVYRTCLVLLLYCTTCTVLYYLYSLLPVPCDTTSCTSFSWKLFFYLGFKLPIYMYLSQTFMIDANDEFDNNNKKFMGND